MKLNRKLNKHFNDRRYVLAFRVLKKLQIKFVIFCPLECCSAIRNSLIIVPFMFFSSDILPVFSVMT